LQKKARDTRRLGGKKKLVAEYVCTPSSLEVEGGVVATGIQCGFTCQESRAPKWQDAKNPKSTYYS
jgi:hypothetical protein